jgi:hypothetical protein
MKLKSFALVGALLAAAPLAIASAETTPRSSSALCYRARPSPDCSVFFLTNAGLYVKPRSNDSTPWRGIVDWGVMVNVSPRDAVGGSWFVTLDENDVTTGPEVRYRRWFGRDESLDVAVGTPLNRGQVEIGSVLGLVKYNSAHWCGIAVRPEYVRRRAYDYSQYPNVTRYTVTSTRVYGGVEFGWFPGLTLTLGSGVVLLALIAALND